MVLIPAYIPVHISLYNVVCFIGYWFVLLELPDLCAYIHLLFLILHIEMEYYIIKLSDPLGHDTTSLLRGVSLLRREESLLSIR